MKTKLQNPRACILLALTILSTGSPKDPAQESASADIYEAVIRYQIRSWDLAANSYCVKINGRDPGKNFLSRFNPLPVKGASGCRKQKTSSVFMQVHDKKIGRLAVIFDVEAIRWLTENEAKVEGGYFCGSLCMAGGDYHVVRDGTRWVVTGYDVHIQS
jgi:hypothetical protein